MRFYAKIGTELTIEAGDLKEALKLAKEKYAELLSEDKLIFWFSQITERMKFEALDD